MGQTNAARPDSGEAERYQAEARRGSRHREARQIALRSALIPQINSLFAVGLVSFPGMMTG